MMALIADGTLRPDLLVGEVIELDAADDALAAIDGAARSAGVTVIDVLRG